MRRRTVLASFVMASSVGIAAQGDEFARLVPNGEHATLSVFGPRPVALAAKKLVDEFRVAINVEDPVYLYHEDIQEIGLAGSDRHALIPKFSFLEMRVDRRADGSLVNVQEVVQDLVNVANTHLPFAYRIDRDSDTFSLVATQTRDAHGRFIDLVPILDNHVTIPRGTRSFREHVTLMMRALELQTGSRIACCTGVAESQPGPLIEFGADDEPARNAFLRLVRSRPARQHLVRTESARYHLVPSEPGGYYWLMNCQPRESWCFINLHPIPDKALSP